MAFSVCTYPGAVPAPVASIPHFPQHPGSSGCFLTARRLSHQCPPHRCLWLDDQSCSLRHQGRHVCRAARHRKRDAPGSGRLLRHWLGELKRLAGIVEIECRGRRPAQSRRHRQAGRLVTDCSCLTARFSIQACDGLQGRPPHPSQTSPTSHALTGLPDAARIPALHNQQPTQTPPTSHAQCRLA